MRLQQAGAQESTGPHSRPGGRDRDRTSAPGRRPSRSSVAPRAARLLVGVALIGLAGLVAHDDLKIRAFEAWLAARVATGARCPQVRSRASPRSGA